jgi:hypothetical protein
MTSTCCSQCCRLQGDRELLLCDRSDAILSLLFPLRTQHTTHISHTEGVLLTADKSFAEPPTPLVILTRAVYVSCAGTMVACGQLLPTPPCISPTYTCWSSTSSCALCTTGKWPRRLPRPKPLELASYTQNAIPVCVVQLDPLYRAARGTQREFLFGHFNWTCCQTARGVPVRMIRVRPPRHGNSTHSE